MRSRLAPSPRSTRASDAITEPMSTPSRFFGLLLTLFVLGVWSPENACAAAVQLEGASASSSALVAFSKEVTKLRRRAHELTVAVYSGRTRHIGVYLGEGIVVTPHFDALERGQSAHLATSRGAYRLRVLANTKVAAFMPDVTFFRLHDPLDQKSLDQRPLAAAGAKPGWRDRLGDLVFVRQNRSFGPHFVRRSMRVRRGRDREAEEATPFAYQLAVEQCDPGSIALAADASVAGMVVAVETRSSRRARMMAARRAARSESRAEKSAEKSAEKNDEKNAEKIDEGQKKPERKASDAESKADARDYYYAIVDTGWLLAAGKIALEEGLPDAAYSIGVVLDEAPESKEVFVSLVYQGSPAQRAGLRRRDRLLKVGGEDFSRDRIRALIARGKPFELRYRRRVRGAAPVEETCVVQPRR